MPGHTKERVEKATRLRELVRYANERAGRSLAELAAEIGNGVKPQTLHQLLGGAVPYMSTLLVLEAWAAQQQQARVGGGGRREGDGGAQTLEPSESSVVERIVREFAEAEALVTVGGTLSYKDIVLAFTNRVLQADVTDPAEWDLAAAYQKHLMARHERLTNAHAGKTGDPRITSPEARS